MTNLDFLPDNYHARRLPSWVASALKNRFVAKARGQVEALARRAISRPSQSAAATVAVAIIAGAGFRTAMGPRGALSRASASITAPVQYPSQSQQKQLSVSRPITALSVPNRPPQTRPALITGQENPADLFHRQTEKSTPQTSDQKKREKAQDYITQAESQLRLQSILAGSRPRALVNGKIVERGDVVASFRVLEIEPRRIIIEREGIRLVIPMN